MKFVCVALAVLLGVSLWLGYQLHLTRQQVRNQPDYPALQAALRDSVRLYRDQAGRVVAEKRAIEADFAQIEAHQAELSGNQRALLADVAALPRAERKTVASATSIQQVVRLRARDSLAVTSPGGRTWAHESDTLSYRISTRDSLLTIEKLELPNRLSVVTYRDSCQVLHVQVTNSNPIFRTQDVDAVVPEKPKKKRILLKILALLGAAALGYAAH